MGDGSDHGFGIAELFGVVEILVAFLSSASVELIVVVWVVDMELPWINADDGA